MNSTGLSSSSLILSSASSSLLLNLSVELFRTSMVAQMVKNACNAGDSGSVPALGRSPGERNGNPLQYSYLENSLDRGARQATVHVTIFIMFFRLVISLSYFLIFSLCCDFPFVHTLISLPFSLCSHIDPLTLVCIFMTVILNS